MNLLSAPPVLRDETFRNGRRAEKAHPAMLLRRASRLSRLSRLSSSGPRISELGEEEAQFRHKSMYPQRERILFSLAYELRQHEESNGGKNPPISMQALRELCYRGTKLQDEEIELLLSAAEPIDESGEVDLSHFVSAVAHTLLPARDVEGDGSHCDPRSKEGG